MKSNSLGILGAGKAHGFFGPARVHWEGGYAGERKIGNAKQWMGIKRSNADWQTIAMTGMYQLDSLQMLWEKCQGHSKKGSRELEGTLKIYGTVLQAQEAITNRMHLSGVLDKDNNVWIACRPNDGVAGNRSAILLIGIEYDDLGGALLGDMCWFAPILEKNTFKRFNSREELQSFTSQYVLLLPMLNDKGDEYTNLYYTIGNKWTERVAHGGFEMSELPPKAFREWLRT